MQLAVLNPGGRDREQSFPDFAGFPGAVTSHSPVNYHAYAACIGGTFYRDPARIPPTQREVLLILRRDLKHCLKTLKQLKADGKKVAVSLKESGLHQVAKILNDSENLLLFREICAAADGALASTSDLVGIYTAAGAKSSRFIPTPYPVDSDKWNFTLPLAQRSGIFIGTREWDTPSRNHAAALLLAASLNAPVTVINEDGRAGRKRIEAIGLANPQIIEGRLPYPDYLRLVARNRILFQLDRSAVPGQVAGDALLAGIPCIGGDGAIDRIAFPDICSYARDPQSLHEIAATLLQNDQACESASAQSRQLALTHLSFPTISQSLADYFTNL